MALREDPPMSRILALPVAVAALVLGAGATLAECPLNSIWTGCNDLVVDPSNAPTHTVGGGAWTAGTACPAGCYDLPHGALHAENGTDPHNSFCATDMLVYDDYSVTGGQSGVGYPVEAILRVTGSVTGVGGVRISLYDAANPGGEVSWSIGVATPSLDAAVALPLTMTPGTPVRLVMRLAASGSFPGGYGVGDAVLRFQGLPKGMAVTSCQAYELPVPARTTSWGSLKSTYR